MAEIARADVVGSLLRPPYLQEARQALAEGAAVALAQRSCGGQVALP